jgi:Cysteine-rich secretory protein family
MASSSPRSGPGLLTMTSVVIVALLATLLATSPVAAQAAPSPSVAAIEQRMAELANQSRAAVGARPVAVDVNFAAASRDWSCQMARTNQFAHDPNFAAGGALAEIIAARSGADGDVGAQLHQQFLDSPPHREILLNPASSRVGIGVCVLNGYWVTERFGTGAAVAAPAPTTPTRAPSTTRPTPTTIASTTRSTPTTAPSRVQSAPTTTQRVRPVARRTGLVRHRGPDSVPGSLDGSGDIAAKQGESGALPFTGASITLPLVLVAVTLLLGGGLALRLGRSRYRPAHLRR